MTKRRVAVLAGTVLCILAADQITKALVRASFEIGESHPVVSGVLWLTHVHNTGAAFGMFRGQQWFLIGVAIAVLAAIGWTAVRVRLESPLARTALAMIAAGTLGNLVDRAVSGGVTDFLDLGWFPVFNVADISLDVGVALLVWWLLFSSEHAKDAGVAAAVVASPEEPDPAEGQTSAEVE
ncbi:MAG: signal peptidase II [Coriobacteriia bacterium]|nr:signal peptidase II [Coriobacteriia bacterium]